MQVRHQDSGLCIQDFGFGDYALKWGLATTSTPCSNSGASTPRVNHCFASARLFDAR